MGDESGGAGGDMAGRLEVLGRLRREGASGERLAEALCWAAAACEEAGEGEASASLFRESFAEYARVPGRAALLRGGALGVLARGLASCAAFEEAEAICRLRLALCEGGAAPAPGGEPDEASAWKREQLSSARVSYGELLERLGRHPEAEALFRRAFVDALGAAPDASGASPELPAAMHRVAMCCARQGKLAEADALLVAATAELSRVGGADASRVADYLVDRAEVCRRTGRPDEARRLEIDAARRYRQTAAELAAEGRDAARARLERRGVEAEARAGLGPRA